MCVWMSSFFAHQCYMLYFVCTTLWGETYWESDCLCLFPFIWFTASCSSRRLKPREPICFQCTSALTFGSSYLAWVPLHERSLGGKLAVKKKTCKVQRRGLVLCLSWGRGSWGPWCADLCLQKLSLGTWIVCALVGKKPQVVQEVEKVAKVTSLSAECFNVGVFSERTGGLTLCDWVFWRGRLELLFMLKQQTAVQSTVSDHGAFGWGSEGDAAWGLITRLFLIIGWFIQQNLRPEISDWLWCYRVCRECAQLCIFIYPWVADCLFLQASVGKSPS